MGNESGELGRGAVEFFRVWELFRPEGGDGVRLRGGDDGSGNDGGIGSANDIEMKVELGYLLLKGVDSFVDDGELGTGSIPLMTDTLDEGGDVLE